ncbi:MAG: permease-like cell division protein FtsX [Gammaproteobacteria bacterium]|nr:permease-like cell division protein FtsX [Gammaproteobacteria bacterium]
MAKTPERGVKIQRNAPLKAYFLHHIRVFISSLGELTRRPIASMMTITVIAIALALPSGMYLLLHNVNQISADWDSSAQMSLFIKDNISKKKVERLAGRLNLRNDIESTKIITPEQALEDFVRISGFGDALNSLDKNPLPAVIVLQPIIDNENPLQVSQLLHDMKQLPEVDIAQLDLDWVKRLYTMLDIANRAVWVISILLGIAVLLTVGNTIRLDIQNRKEEIIVTKLIGATNAFIRRPFLYTGLWYGLIGSLLALALTSIALSLLSTPVQKLASLYNSNFELIGLSLDNSLMLILTSCVLSLGGSWLAVGRQLSKIEPR